MRGFIVDRLLAASSFCNNLSEFLKNAALEIYRRRRRAKW